MNGVSWPLAVIFVATVAGAVVLLAIHRDATALLALLATLIGTLTLQKAAVVERNTNGAQSQLQAELAATRRQMAELAANTVPADVARQLAAATTPRDTTSE